MIKKIGIFVLLIMITSSVHGKRRGKKSEDKTKPEISLKSDIDSLSYAIGLSIASNIRQNFDTLSPEAFSAAIASVYGKEDTALMTTEEATAYVNAYFMNMMAEKAEENLKKSENFLSENKKQEGVLTTESGLQYKIIEEGSGTKPTANSKVKVHYRGTLIDGKEFDSSYRRGEAATFGVTQVIQGWTEALQLMQEGAKYILYIHPDLAYGEQGPESIGPNQALIFEVELIEVLEK